MLCRFQDDELVVGMPWDLFLALSAEMARRDAIRIAP
ncbi:MAG TPA: hypothetical protein ENN19_17725 [Chloroflexi bacterium]|nr:hypothetical protein [Chloroflexota bacterium]